MAAALIRAAALARGASLALTCCQSCSGRTLGGARLPRALQCPPPAPAIQRGRRHQREENTNTPEAPLFFTSPAKDLLISTGLIIMKKKKPHKAERSTRDVLNVSRRQSSFHVTLKMYPALIKQVSLHPPGGLWNQDFSQIIIQPPSESDRHPPTSPSLFSSPPSFCAVLPKEKCE